MGYRKLEFAGKKWLWRVGRKNIVIRGDGHKFKLVTPRPEPVQEYVVPAWNDDLQRESGHFFLDRVEAERFCAEQAGYLKFRAIPIGARVPTVLTIQEKRPIQITPTYITCLIRDCYYINPSKGINRELHPSRVFDLWMEFVHRPSNAPPESIRHEFVPSLSKPGQGFCLCGWPEDTGNPTKDISFRVKKQVLEHIQRVVARKKT